MEAPPCHVIAKPPPTAADIPNEWTATVAGILRRNGHAMRAHPTLPMIEIKSLRTNEWGKLMLFGSGFLFASDADRNAVIRRILG